MKYADMQKVRCMEKISEINEHLPSYAASYISHVATKKDTSFRTGLAYAYDIQIFFQYFVEEKHMKLEEVTPAFLGSLLAMDIEAYIARLTSYETNEDKAYNAMLRETHSRKPRKKHQMAASARARNLAAVRGLYKYLMKNGYITTNPAALADTPQSKVKPVITMDSEEVRDVMSNIENTNVPLTRKKFAEKQKLRDTALITLMLYTGIRVSECVGIDLSDIDWKNNGVKVRRKGGNDETVYFNDEVARVLGDYIDNERIEPEYDKDALFVSRKNERISTRAVERLVKKYTAGVTANKITPHKLRSSYATKLYENTGDAYLVKDALGHKTLGVVQKYIDASDANRKTAAITINYGE